MKTTSIKDIYNMVKAMFESHSKATLVFRRNEAGELTPFCRKEHPRMVTIIEFPDDKLRMGLKYFEVDLNDPFFYEKFGFSSHKELIENKCIFHKALVLD